MATIVDTYKVAIQSAPTLEVAGAVTALGVGQNTAFGELAVAEMTPITGWTFAYNVNTDMVTKTTTGTGAITASSGRAVLSSSAAINSSAMIASNLPLRYITGQGGLARFTAVFTQGVPGNTQLIGIGDASDGLFFGFDGAYFGILRRSAGVDNWVYEEAWEPGYDWGFDPTKGNVYQIRFQWLGYGEIQFSIENPETGGFVLVHRIQYANAHVNTSIRNPTLPIHASSTNTKNSTDVVLMTPSAMAFVEGKVENPTPLHPFALPRVREAAKATITTQTSIVTLKSLATWQSVTNRVRSRIRGLSAAVEGTKVVTIKITKGATLGGSPSYSNHSADTSPVQYDVAGTTVTGGTLVYATKLQKTDSRFFDLDYLGIEMGPGETLTFSAESSSSADIDLVVFWTDMF